MPPASACFTAHFEHVNLDQFPLTGWNLELLIFFMLKCSPKMRRKTPWTDSDRSSFTMITAGNQQKCMKD